MVNNLPADKPNTKVEQMFNGAFYQSIPVDENTYTIVNTFFLGKMNGIEDVAKTLTQSLITMCHNTKLNPLDLLNEFDKVASESDFKRRLIAVLNQNRYPTSKLGYSRGITPNRWVQRNIVA